MSVQSTANSELELSQLIQQAEIMQLKMEMELRFKRNMSFLQKGAPPLWERLKDFTPKHIQLFISHKGEINLINMDSKNPVYEKDAREFAKEQMDHFLLKPTRFNIHFKPTEIVNPKHLHPESVNQALEAYNACEFKNHYDPSAPIGLLVILGCGLGYHIEEVLKVADLKNLIIYENIDDCFYASLYTVDWENIVEKINRRGGKVKLYIGDDYHTALRKMRGISYEIGMHNMVSHFIYSHTESTDNELFYENFKVEFPIQISSLGFYDDEQVSFSHTIHNINQNLPIFTPQKNNNLPPIFVVGNGPSLDMLVEKIRHYKDQVVVISCGSALPSLFKAGIQPDMHIEVERNLGVAEMISYGTTIEFTQKIPLLAVNNISPEVIKLFKQTYIAIKPNDIGACMLRQLIPSNKYSELNLCNPTVTNCGFSFALSLGFSEIYLLGTDFGMVNTLSHHSKLSIWKNMDSKRESEEKLEKDAIEDYTYSKGQFNVKGNFVDEVITNPILNTSRINIEILIRENNQINCYNPNNGAHIEGTQTIKNSDIEIGNYFNTKEEKQLFIKTLLDDNFSEINFSNISLNQINENYLNILFKTKGAFLLDKKCKSMADLHKQMDRIFANLQKIDQINTATPMLIRGSFQVHSGMLISYCSKAKTQAEFEQCYKAGRDIYNAFITTVLDSLEKDPLALDDTLALH